MIPSSEKGVRFDRCKSFSHFKTEKSLSTVAVLGKGEANPPQNSINSGNRSLMDGVLQASLKSVCSLWRAKAVCSLGSLMTAFRSFLCWSTIKSMAFWFQETNNRSWNFRTNFVELSVRNGGPSNVQVVDYFLKMTSRPKQTQNWQRTATTSEEPGSRAVMESPYCRACFVWNGVLRAPAWQGRYRAGSEFSIDWARMQ